MPYLPKPAQVLENPSEFLRQQPLHTYLVCLSSTVCGCVAVAVNVGQKVVEWVRVQMPLEGPEPGSMKITYQLEDEGEDKKTMGRGWSKPLPSTQLACPSLPAILDLGASRTVINGPACQ
jgi:hypothetical protein